MLFQFLGLLAQFEGEGGGDAPAANDAGGAVNNGDGGGSIFGGFGLWIPLVMMVFVMFLLSRPRKADVELKKRLETLKKNDRVVTAGGIIGTVVSVRDDNSVMLRIDDTTNTRMQVLKSSIIRFIENDKVADGN